MSDNTSIREYHIHQDIGILCPDLLRTILPSSVVSSKVYQSAVIDKKEGLTHRSKQQSSSCWSTVA